MAEDDEPTTTTMSGAAGDAPDDGSSSGSSMGSFEALGGQPVQECDRTKRIICVESDEHSFSLDAAALDRVLGAEEVRNKPVCVVSVAGILMWSEVFLLKREDGTEVAVVLMDTQGAFDSSSTVRDCATIFALSAMLSSVLVYNLTSNIQEDDLQHLELFTEYGRLALEDSGETPFQKLQFLIRDWSFPYEQPWGDIGGKNLVEKRLQVSDRQHPELQDLRKHIRSCFSSIEGFLLPHPGLNVATNPNFKGQVRDIEKEFIRHLAEFVPKILAPEKVVVKKISGNVVKCKELIGFFKAYVEIFKGSQHDGDEMPEPKSMLQATSEANNLASLSAAKETYVKLMESVCGGEKPYINEQVLDIEHCRIKDQALEVFTSRRKMGGEEFSASYREQLEREIEEAYKHYKAHNDSKNIFKAANTPITLAAVAMLLYVFCQFFNLIGLTPVAALFNLAMMIVFGLLATWAYAKYSGNITEVGASVDNVATNIWDMGLQPLMNTLADQGAQMATRQAMKRLNSTDSQSKKKKKQ